MSPSPGRIASEWLAYIRPHVRPYEALGRGDRRDYIAKLSKRVKLSDNTLRRFISAAQYLEAEGITELPSEARMPVAAVERVARIAARQPEKRQQLLKDVAEGRLTIVELRELLKKSIRAAGKRQRISNPEEPLEKRALAVLEARGVLKRSHAVLATFQDMEHWPYFDSQTNPVVVILLSQDRRIVAMDDRSLGGTAASFTRKRREFLRNILAGTALYDLVLVFASIWQEDVGKLIGAMRPEMRQRVILFGPEA
ncbi:hypothetical protein LRP30_04545 [Bradyrhizobium sp. C-145]|uniref:hypothetical protein n=1 Tax=Bradyrhizobium sp. C-145 TaxID=574727 RepID=UPI00201B754B|nr:hypothetical protein [Bradyrhizobium sp. C-145]UQR64579.1 hypothetical protein LRP30_04545 [Bradyrhizobium sp. C-145]